MALVKCPECGKEISDTAGKCPKCGYKMKQTKINTKKVIIIISFVIALVLVYLFFTKDNDPFKGLKNHPSSDEVSTILGQYDDEHEYEGTIYNAKIIETYYNQKFCGYNGQIEIYYGSSDKDYAREIVWRYYFKDGYEYEDIEKCVKKISNHLTKKYGKPLEGSYSALNVWEDSQKNKYAIKSNHNGYVFVEFWN